MNVDEALLIADNVHTGLSGHIKALQVLATEVRRQHAEIERLTALVLEGPYRSEVNSNERL
jgi:hypothetical protein